jgi:prephenate dehydratase
LYVRLTGIAAYETESDFTVLPLENTIFGPVTETLDCLIQGLDESTSRPELDEHPTAHVEMINGQVDRKGKKKQQTIIGSLDLPIQHCLVVKKGTKMEDIQWVRSHEQVSTSSVQVGSAKPLRQALGQSTNFLNKYLPRAKLVPTASTALAAQYLLSADPSEEVGSAICSRSVVDLQPDLLEVLYEGTQDRKGVYILHHDSGITDRMNSLLMDRQLYSIFTPHFV